MLMPPRVVVTLASIPARLARIGPLLESLAAQERAPDVVYLRLCRLYRRWSLRLEPDDLPAALRARPGLIVRWDEDRGPFTKLAGTLIDETDPQTVIVTADDDRRLPPQWLGALAAAAAAHGDCAVTLRGRRLARDEQGRAVLRYGSSTLVIGPAQPQPVDICTGAMGTALRRCMLGGDLIEDWAAAVQACPGLFYSDDIWISGSLARRGVPRLAIPAPAALGRGNWRRNDFYLDRRQHRTAPLYEVNAARRHHDDALAFFAGAW
jgi:hypothetical protein